MCIIGSPNITVRSCWSVVEQVLTSSSSPLGPFLSTTSRPAFDRVPGGGGQSWTGKYGRLSVRRRLDLKNLNLGGGSDAAPEGEAGTGEANNLTSDRM